MPDVTLTDAELAEIEARAKAATPGPWVASEYLDDGRWGVLADGNKADGNEIVVGVGSRLTKEGAAFIAAARADVPALIAALRASRERERRYETAGRRWIEALDMMRSLTVHDPRQNQVVNLMTEAERQMRAALGEEAPHE